jgi:hypothetical protein
MVKPGVRLSNMASTGMIISKLAPNPPKWLNSVQNGLKWSKTALKDPKWLAMV